MCVYRSIEKTQNKTEFQKNRRDTGMFSGLGMFDIIGFAIGLVGIAIEITSGAFIYTHTSEEETERRNIATQVFDIGFKLIIIGLLIVLTNTLFMTAVSRS